MGSDMIVMNMDRVPDHIQYVIGLCLRGEYDGKKELAGNDVAWIHITQFDVKQFPLFDAVERVYVAFQKGVLPQ